MDVSSEGTQSVELPDLLTIKALRDVKEEFNHTRAFNSNVSNLMGVDMTSEGHSESLKVFQDFIDLVSSRLDMSVITSMWMEMSFIFAT